MGQEIESPAATPPLLPEPAAGQAWPRLLADTKLLGPATGSGLREPPYLVRRCDGQVVQLSNLLYTIASHMDGRDLAEIAQIAGTRLNLRITPAQIAHVAEQKLAPLGLVPYRNGTIIKLQRRNALLALKFRAGVLPERAVNFIARLLAPLFRAPATIASALALLAFDGWLATSHGLAAGLQTVIYTPTLALALFALLIVSLFFHECGHAAGCRYSGARPGRIGIGIYLVWPVLYTDVTDSYRLSKAGRLRTDLGGIYFNALFAVTAVGAYLATSYKPLLIVVVTQQILMLDQFIPWVRLDGYHVVSDLVGVSDLFARIKPTVASLVPGRRSDPRVTELKSWARVAVTTWVFTTLAALAGIAFLIGINASSYLARTWQSLIIQLDQVGHGVQTASTINTLTGAIGAITLLLPAAGVTLSFLLLCRGTGTLLALHQSRLDSPAAASREPIPATSGSHQRSPTGAEGLTPAGS